MIPLHDREGIEDLQLGGLRIIQSRDGFRFGEDSVLLANVAAAAFSHRRRPPERIADLGCNAGAIALIMAFKLPRSRIVGIEIAEDACSLFRRNIELNGLGDRISCVQADWNDLRGIVPAASADCVVSNPPYARRRSDDANRADDRRIAREEIRSDAAGLAEAAAYLLRPGGLAFMIYRADRLADVLAALRASRLEPVRIRFVHPFADRAPGTFIVMSRKHGRPAGLKVEKPLVVREAPGRYAPEVRAMYGDRPTMPAQELLRGVCASDAERMGHRDDCY